MNDEIKIFKVDNYDVEISRTKGLLDCKPMYLWKIVQESDKGGHVTGGQFDTVEQTLNNAKQHINKYGNNITIQIYTSYYANLKRLTALHYKNFYAISGKIPEWYLKQDNKIFKTYKQLATKYEWWKEWYDKKISNDEYVEKYYETVFAIIFIRTDKFI